MCALFGACTSRQASTTPPIEQPSYTRSELKAWIADRKTAAATFREQGEYDSARSVLDEVIERLQPYADTLNLRKDLAWLYAGRAYICGDLEGRFLNARQDYLKAEQCFRQIDSIDAVVGRYVFEPLGNIYSRLGDPAQASTYLERCFDLAVAAGDSVVMVETCSDLGIAWMEAHVFEQSALWIDRGLALNSISNRHRAMLTIVKARLYALQDQWRPARHWSQEAWKLFPRTIDKRRWVHELVTGHRLAALNIMIEAAGAMGDSTAVISWTDTAMTLVHETYTDQSLRKLAKVNLAAGRAFLKLGKPTQAIAHYDQALERLLPGFSPSNGSALPEVGSLYPEHLIGDALIGKANAYQQQFTHHGRRETALLVMKHFDLMFQLEAEVRSELLANESRLGHSAEYARMGKQAVQFAHELYMETGADSLLWKAFSYAESSKGFLLSEALRTSWLSTSAGQVETLEALNNVRDEMAQWKAGQMNDERSEQTASVLDDLRFEEARLKDKLAAEHPALYRQLYTPNDLSATDIEAWQREQEGVLLTMFEGREQWFVFCLSANGLESTAIPHESQVMEELSAFAHAHETPGTSTPERFHQIGHRLYQRLLGRFESTLAQHETWTIIPDGVLAGVNVELLVTKPGKSTSYRDVPYVMYDHTVHFAPSLSFLMRPRAEPSFAEEVVEFQPSFACDTLLTPIHGIDWEGADGYAPTLTLAGLDANPESLKEIGRRARIIHLATHGLALGNQPGDSWIALSDSSGCRHQRMYFPQLQAARLQAELAVLQACQSGRGRYASGEGVLSISHSFMHAGCANVISSAWDVNPKASSEVLTRFYEHLGAAKGPAQSLRQAKLDYLASESLDELSMHPYYWSGMVLVGSGNMHQPKQGSPEGLIYMLILFLISLGMLIRGLRRINRRPPEEYLSGTG